MDPGIDIAKCVEHLLTCNATSAQHLEVQAMGGFKDKAALPLSSKEDKARYETAVESETGVGGSRRRTKSSNTRGKDTRVSLPYALRTWDKGIPSWPLGLPLHLLKENKKTKKRKEKIERKKQNRTSLATHV